MKYIDADLLRKNIDNWKTAMTDAVGEYSDGVRFALEHFTFALDSLQQELEVMDCSFEGGCYDIVEKFIQKKLTGLTEFELALSNYLKNDFEYFHSKKWDEQKWNDVIRTQSKELIALAKKQLLSYPDESNPKIEAMADLERTFECNPDKLPRWLKEELSKKHLEGYIMGRQDTLREMSDFVESHFGEKKEEKIVLPTMPTTPSGWGCDGTHCTNPHMDCINCPRQTTGGMFNTQSGTSTLKAEG